MSHDKSVPVDERARVAGADRQNRPQQPFGEVLRKQPPEKKAQARRPPPLPGADKAVAARGVRSAQVALSPQARIGGAEALSAARSVMHQEVSRLQLDRVEGHVTQEQRVKGRMLDLLVRELAQEERGQAQARIQTTEAPGTGTARAADTLAPIAGAGPLGGGQADPGGNQPPHQAEAAARAQAALALVERIETFVKSQRPAIALTVGGALNVRVEVERTGRNEVALKVQGKRGPPPPEDVARIREAISARGLKLSSLSLC